MLQEPEDVGDLAGGAGGGQPPLRLPRLAVADELAADQQPRRIPRPEHQRARALQQLGDAGEEDGRRRRRRPRGGRSTA